MIHLDGQLTTDDLAFAVVLALNGFHPVIERQGQGVIWIVSSDDLDEDMESFLDDYGMGRIRVEPRRFVRELAAMRRDMYVLLGVDKQPRGTRVARPDR